ncbi:hypothetical protein CARUB_v10027389mg [Capsella rubella]|uniref:ER membrane protein complex subunit 3 n=1 Tax=Capsella rubella TaxID=81985 RepID=R0GSR0_9BRAS|nr:hypothetical protein CARUB_v10027389mg [Capsella rubella]
MAEDLVLDTAIRDWVLISLSVVMVLIGILRYFVSKLMRSSLYFLNLFGLRGLFSLILEDENAVDDTQRMLQMGGFGFDASKDGLNIIQHEWALPRFEHHAESVLRKLVRGRPT